MPVVLTEADLSAVEMQKRMAKKTLLCKWLGCWIEAGKGKRFQIRGCDLGFRTS